MSDLEIGPRVHALAEKIAQDALDDDDKAFRLDCFKALSQFFIGMTRISGKKGEDDEGGALISMIDMRANVGAAENGAESSLVRSARRRAAGESRDRDRNGRFE
jgi:hypothetical protein